jgi:type VI secretion system protein ImpA
MREFRSALAGKPDTQFAPAVPPDFRKVIELVEELFTRTRDLSIAVGWCRAMLRTRGIQTLAPGLRLLHGLFVNFGNSLHPQADPDDGSYYARGNAIAVLSDSSGLLGDLRQAVLLSDRIHGEVRTRSIEIALGKLSPREDEEASSLEQVRAFFASHSGSQALRVEIEEARRMLQALSAELNSQIDAADAPDLSALASMLETILSMLPAPAPAGAAAEASATVAAPVASASASAARPTAAQPAHAAPGAITSREDVIRMIDMACEYLERAEPTNPAQLLLRRAKHLLDQNFLQLIHVLAPASLDEVARLMGVDAESLRSPSNGT